MVDFAIKSWVIIFVNNPPSLYDREMEDRQVLLGSHKLIRLNHAKTFHKTTGSYCSAGDHQFK